VKICFTFLNRPATTMIWILEPLTLQSLLHEHPQCPVFFPTSIPQSYYPVPVPASYHPCSPRCVMLLLLVLAQMRSTTNDVFISHEEVAIARKLRANQQVAFGRQCIALSTLAWWEVSVGHRVCQVSSCSFL
jgi:hypothetical protein